MLAFLREFLFSIFSLDDSISRTLRSTPKISLVDVQCTEKAVALYFELLESRLTTFTTAPGARFDVANPYLFFCSSFTSSEIVTSRGQKALSRFD